MDKKEKLLSVSKSIAECIGGEENILGVAHCATRLRIVLKDNSLADMEKIENIELVKGSFMASDQLQIIFGTGLVDEVYAVFSKLVHKENSSLAEVKEKSLQKQNKFQMVIKSLSDVFVELIPAILAAALLMGLTGVFSKWDVVLNNPALYGINRLASLASVAIFAILPMAVCYSATKRFGGRPVLGLVVGSIMIDSSLANAYSIGTAGFNPEVLNIFGLQIEMVGFQGGIIVALMMGWVVASLDKYLQKKIPDVVKLLVVPMLTVFLSTVLLFVVVGPAGRFLADTITGSLLWITENLGFVGYAVFAGLQQILVITGLHHILGAVESQLIASTGTNFLNPLMSVALIGQAGAVLGVLACNWNNTKMRELCIPSFVSTLFGISEPAIFGVNLKYRYPLIAGCIGGAVAGIYVYFAKITSLGFGATALPGLAIVDANNHGYIQYIIAHLIGLGVAMILTIVYVKLQNKKTVDFTYPAKGKVESITEANDTMFASKALGDGIVITPTDSKIVAPCNAVVEFVYPTKHAIGLRLENGVGCLIHCGINTSELNGEHFEVMVSENQKVNANTVLLKMDYQAIEKLGYDTQVVTIITEVPESIQCTINPKESKWFTFN